MVVFSCSACGETLKKSHVEKHLRVCKSCWVIVCLDCNTEFEGQAFASHTSCISEKERYEKSVYKAPGKGGKRDPQAEWVDTIARAASAGGAHAALLNTLTGYGNCPRKIKPFVSFCKNSLKVHNEKLLGELFAAIQAFLPPRPEKKQSGGGGAGAAAATGDDTGEEEGAAEEKVADKMEREEAAEEVEGEEAAEEVEREEDPEREEEEEEEGGGGGGGAEPGKGGKDKKAIKAFIKAQLAVAKNKCVKAKKLAQGASKAGLSARAVEERVLKALSKGKLVRCDFRGTVGAATAKKGKYLKKAPKASAPPAEA
jgi:cell growth-regulating nucleolar protein